ncbi:MAG: cell division protein FtsI [Firmicutes bacterium]|nr:cell division protein FtsI [Bacillota bacterium]
MDYYLLGLNPELRLQNMLKRLRGEVPRGNDVRLALDAELQAYAMDLLDGRRGAAVVLDPRTGEVLAMASQPSFEPAAVDEYWTELSTDRDAPLVNRATDGAYPPGSLMKIVTAAAALEGGKVAREEVFSCPGRIVVDGFELRDTAAHGRVDLVRALAVSCNTTFAELGLRVGADGLFRAAQAFGFGRASGLELPERGASLPEPGEMTRPEVAATAIGQGRALVSPLRMALAAAAVANGGVIMQPRLVLAVTDPEGRTVFASAPRAWLTATTPQAAETIRDGMVAAVRAGTAKQAALPGVTVAGKTGSAQNPQGAPHAWFVGFAPAEAPRAVVAVIVENGGAGGTVAAPLGRELLKRALERGGLEDHAR